MTDNNDFLSADWVNPEYGIKVLPPTLQWRRGDLTNANPLLKNGCWQLPVEHFEAIVNGSMEKVDVLHAGGVVVPSYLLDIIHIAILAHRKRWYVKDGNGVITWLPPNFEQTPGMRSRLQVWALVKELGNEPALISVSGMNSKALDDAVGSFIQKVIKPAARMAKKTFGRHHFWLPLITAGKVTTKNNQYITPPVLAISEFDTEILRSLFTGKDVAEMAESMIPEARAWATARDEAIMPVEHIEPETQEEEAFEF